MGGARKPFTPLLRPTRRGDAEGAVHPCSRRGTEYCPDVARTVCHLPPDV